MSVTTTSAPARARARQSARPRPRDPPVTRATFPLRSIMASSPSGSGAWVVLRPPARPPGEQAGGVDVDRHLGQLEADALVLDDGLAERHPLLGVVECVLVGGAGDTKRAGGDRRPGVLEHLQRAECPRTGIGITRLAAQAILRRHETVLEDDLR